jgi:3-hydroxymyristoyl/3-hydroxydecanoyl-(acyl carrier protein) dehydratase
VSAVPVSSILTARPFLKHPWVQSARIDVPQQSSECGPAIVRIVLSAEGVDVLRAHGKSHLVEVLGNHFPAVPPQPRTWRLVDDLDASTTDQDDWLNRPRVRTVRVVSAVALEATLFVPYDLRIFDGHFETVPVLPGVLQIGWALELAQGHLAGIGSLQGITAVKFRRLVRPGMELNLAIHRDEPQRELQFDYRHGGQATSSGRLRMTMTDD